jgi:hypothetical protein
MSFEGKQKIFHFPFLICHYAGRTGRAVFLVNGYTSISDPRVSALIRGLVPWFSFDSRNDERRHPV